MYHKYLVHRHGWTSHQRGDIDWEVLRRAISNAQINPIQLMKLVHDKLPTGYELSKSNRHHSPTCHHCSAQETFLYLLQCNSPTSVKFREELLTQMVDYMQNRAVPLLFQEAIVTCVQHSLNGPTYQQPSRHPAVMISISSQTQIGQHLLLRGFATVQWRTLYTKLTSFENVTASGTSSTAALDIITGLIRLF
jgi:hypothetical protein